MRIQAKIIPTIALVAGAALLAPLAAACTARGDIVAGRSAFEKRGPGCHALDHEKEGPRLTGVVGRKAGVISTFAYSDALRKSAVVWTKAVLDKWLTDPKTVIPDNDMSFRLIDPSNGRLSSPFCKRRANRCGGSS
jgi:cytochrome c2